MIDLNGTCNCGRTTRYLHRVEGEDKMSCNKYTVCPTYDELDGILSERNKTVLELINIAKDLSLYREGTYVYESAYDKLQDIMKDNGVG